MLARRASDAAEYLVAGSGGRGRTRRREQNPRGSRAYRKGRGEPDRGDLLAGGGRRAVAASTGRAAVGGLGGAEAPRAREPTTRRLRQGEQGRGAKMLAMATNEQLRTTQPNALLELEREQAVRRRRPSHEADKYILPVHREHDEDYDGDARSASTPSKGSPKAVGFAAEPSESERAQPLTCFVTSVMRSVHILLGCEVK